MTSLSLRTAQSLQETKRSLKFPQSSPLTNEHRAIRFRQQVVPPEPAARSREDARWKGWAGLASWLPPGPGALSAKVGRTRRTGMGGDGRRRVTMALRHDGSRHVTIATACYVTVELSVQDSSTTDSCWDHKAGDCSLFRPHNWGLRKLSACHLSTGWPNRVRDLESFLGVLWIDHQ